MKFYSLDTCARFSPLLVVFIITGCANTNDHIQSSDLKRPTADRLKNQSIYIVRKGDTLSAIGRRFKVSARQLQYRNNVNDPRKLALGSRLYIPQRSLKVPASFMPSPKFVWPLKWTNVSSEFGSRGGRHSGTDFRAPKGTPIRVVADGRVIFSGSQRGYGNLVIVQHAGNIQTLYAHTQKNLVVKGQSVSQGSVIATVGRSGNASGYHLHLEFISGGRKLNPRDHIHNYPM